MNISESLQTAIQPPTRIMLDTSVFLNYLNEGKKLQDGWIDLIINPQIEVYVSAISFWEISIKKSLNKLPIKQNLFQIEKLCQMNEFKLINFQHQALEIIENIPWIHRDPFDRYLISQCIFNNLTFMTQDALIKQYAECTELRVV
jgi:PIN domain nuclease of toxin-antitoxin system